jgi:hypothetical protein
MVVSDVNGIVDTYVQVSNAYALGKVRHMISPTPLRIPHPDGQFFAIICAVEGSKGSCRTSPEEIDVYGMSGTDQ